MIKQVAIIIPVYNEEKVIAQTVKSVQQQFKHVVCVDDGSSDDSSAEIAKTKAYLIEHPINMGQGAALQTGIEFARLLPVDYFVTFDADGQHNVRDVLYMFDEINKGKYDIILGSRFLGQTIGASKIKLFILRLAVRFSNLTTGLKLTDTHNGLRVFNRRVAETMRITLPDMAHASEILGIIVDNKYKYKEVPVTVEYTEYSRGKGQSLVNAVNIVFDMLIRGSRK